MAVESLSLMDSRSLVFSEGRSNKFWKIELDGSSHTVTFGRVGTSGQTQTKDFGSDDAARKAFDKLVAEKTKKGYVDAAGGSTASAPSAVKATAAGSKTTAATTPAKTSAKIGEE